MKPLHLTFVALASFLLGSAIGSCDKDETEPTGMRSVHEQRPLHATMPSAGGGMMDQRRADCPMAVQGANVTVTDTEGGVALTFTTETGDVGDLRTRVQHMSPTFETHHGQAGMMWHDMDGKGMGHMAERGPMPAASAMVTDTDLGARLELRPSDASQLDTLREHVRWHQERMHAGECWMPLRGGI